jgi:hypothetical protein
MEDGESAFRVYRLDDCDLLRFTDIMDFYVKNTRICCHLLDPLQEYLVEIYFLGAVLSYWMERMGVPALHASAIVIEGRAVGFMSSSKGGKSSLAGEFVRAGFPLLADDILPLREENEESIVAHPGYPSMRMWPAEAEYFLGHWEDLEVVHPQVNKRWVPVGEGGFGEFCDTSQPLSCLYLPERCDSEEEGVEIVPVSPANSVIELVRHSFASRLVEAMGWQAWRLAFFARLLARVPVRRLRYPGGFEHLEATKAAILSDQPGLRSRAEIVQLATR